MYISEVIVKKHQRRGPKQTGKFSAVLKMLPPTVSLTYHLHPKFPHFLSF